ncbi:copper resistance protein CopC [Pedococcus sp. KACC 23699]|uniref:Copper resistance protein CopC n=1 Tax=Pedococcus sp. KACC 23699 TaxID=3149228 RepID=A0AAU7JTX1_9MICO
MASRRGLRGPGATAAAVVLCCCAMLWFTATAAHAHAQLVRSNPAAGSVVAVAPRTLTLTFGEQVEAVDASIDVYDDRFAPVDVGPARTAPGDPLTVGVSLRQGLGRGTYSVAWRVSSGDTHPVAGSFRFSVGAPTDVRGSLPDPGRNEGVGILLGVLRWSGFVGAALGPGAVVGALVVWPEGLGRRRLRTVVVTGLALLVVSTAGGMLLQGVYASGQPLSALWRSPESLDSHSRRFDQVYAVRSYLLVAAAVGVTALLGLPAPVRDRWRRPWVVVAGVATTALLATWPLVGHSAVPPGEGVALVVNLVHIAAMVVWLGGLAVVVVGLFCDRETMVRNGLRRFSVIALTSVAVLVTSGAVLAWREVGSLDALTGTVFGRVLLAKTGAVGVLLVVANLARRWVAGMVVAGGWAPAPASTSSGAALAGPAPTAGRGWKGFTRGLVVELALAGVILALTAVLVAVVPGRQAVVDVPGTSTSQGGPEPLGSSSH